MSLSSGTRLGAFEILALIGAGGMGEVYRARDARLKREVALKVLPEAFSQDPDRVARFQREAEVLASLNHLNIAHIHGLEESSGVRALVMEIVEGPTLADRIATGPIPPDDALAIAKQIADALEAAHEQAIIHRDLKPANIKVREDGMVKILDFGLAKLAAAEGESANAPAITNSPTVNVGGTRAGLLLGTPAYMSPEQARGRAVDKRTDIWAFGCVLYEMLTGRAAFAGATASDTMARILEREPDWTTLPAGTSDGVKRLLARCLEKDPRRRLRDIGDASIDLEPAAVRSLQADTSRGAVETPRIRTSTLAVYAASIALLAGFAGWRLGHRPVEQAASRPVRLSLPFLEGPFASPFGVRHLAIADDGSRVAYTSSSRLWIRRLDQKDAVAVPIVGSNPSFSADGKWVGVFSDPGLSKIPVDGGTPTLIANISARPGGATWRADGTIVFSTTEGLYQVPDSGGQPRLLVKPDRQRHQRAYAWPHFLPDGQAVLFTIVPEDAIEAAEIAVLDLRTLDTAVVLKGGSAARYVPTGHLVYAFGSALRAIRFDPQTRRTRGDPVPISDVDVLTPPDNGAADFAVSAAGTLIFIAPHGSDLRTLVWRDRQGREDPLAVEPRSYQYPRISPDGTRVALDIVAGGNRDIWVLELSRLNEIRLTDGPTEDMLPVWTPDGRRVFFASNRTGNFDIYSQAADGAAGARLEFAGPGAQMPQAFTPDGTQLIVYDSFKNMDMLDLSKPDRLHPLLHGDTDNRVPMLSPDGRWVAYESDESGNRFEIMLRPFPDVGSRREKVSSNGGRYPLWGAKGTELFYVSLEGEMMVVPVTLAPTLQLGRAMKLFDWEKPPAGRSGRPYDVSPLDGRFLMTKGANVRADDGAQVSVVLHWTEELKPR